MKISLVMSACNQGAYLAETIQSAVASFPRRAQYEIIVVDDCSTDDSCREIANLGNVKCIKASSRLGCAGGRRLAASHAEGDVIIITDPHCFYPAKALFRLANHAVRFNEIVQPAVLIEGFGRTEGGAMGIGDKGLYVGRVIRRRQYPALLGSIYAMNRSVYERLGCLPTLPGRVGRWEHMVTTMAWRLRIGIEILTHVTCIHRQYRGVRQFPYDVDYWDGLRNAFWFYASCLPDTYRSIWRPMLYKYHRLQDDRFEIIIMTDAFHQYAEWLKSSFKMSERDFFAVMLKTDNIREHRVIQSVLGCSP